MSNELIRLVQSPIIEEHLRTLKEQVDQRVADAQALVCTEETVQAVKKTRTELNKQFQELEAQRKAVKAAVLAPYEHFEAIYGECVSDAFKAADANLKGKINAVEADMKARCEAGLREYFAELCAAHHVDFVPFERTGIVISMTDAKAKTQPPKKLREQLTWFVSSVAQDVEMIVSLDDAEEIMAEYKQTLDAVRSVGVVQDRHRRIEEEKAARADREEAMAREAEAVKKVESFAPPVVAPAAPPEAPKMARVTFTVTDTVDRLKALKQFLVANGYQYE